MPCDEVIQPGDDTVVPAGLDVGGDRLLGHVQPQVLEAAQLGGRERLVHHVEQRVAAPQ